MNMIHQRTALAQDLCASKLNASSEATFRVRVSYNPYFTNKVPKDAPNPLWNGFNGTFKWVTVTIEELAALIQAGFAITAICRGYRKRENFISSQIIVIDRDTEDIRSTLDFLINQPFVACYAALIHTSSSHTSDKPRSHIIFVLSEQVTDPERYTLYVQALMWLLGAADEHCKDPAHAYFGALGCDLRILGNVLPIAVLDELVNQWQAVQPYKEPVREPAIPLLDAAQLLNEAIRRGLPGNRNNTGFWLARQLRDTGYTIDTARTVMLEYQAAVENTDDNPYTLDEAKDSLNSAYNPKNAYKRKSAISGLIDAVEHDELTCEDSLPVNVLTTYFAVLRIMRETGKTQVALSLRSVERACNGFVDHSTIARHLRVLVKRGRLREEQKSNGRKPTVYSLVWDESRHRQNLDIHAVGDDPPALNVSSLPVSGIAQHFHELQAEPLCAIGAQIHPELVRDDAGFRNCSFGTSALRILSVLVAMTEGVGSLEALCELTHLSARTVGNKVNSLERHGIVTTTRQGRRRAIALTRFWYEAIQEITPALTSFGQDILRYEKAAGQMEIYHDKMAELSAVEEKKRFHEEIAARAEALQQSIQVHKLEAIRQRQAWAQANGMETAPPISLHPRRRKEKQVQQPWAVARHGRYVIPDPASVHTGKGGLLKREQPDYIPAFEGLEEAAPIAFTIEEATDEEQIVTWTF
jgi:DNA-binding transcriptional ArsR family regulator